MREWIRRILRKLGIPSPEPVFSYKDQRSILENIHLFIANEKTETLVIDKVLSKD